MSNQMTEEQALAQFWADKFPGVELTIRDSAVTYRFRIGTQAYTRTHNYTFPDYLKPTLMLMATELEKFALQLMLQAVKQTNSQVETNGVNQEVLDPYDSYTEPAQITYSNHAANDPLTYQNVRDAIHQLDANDDTL